MNADYRGRRATIMGLGHFGGGVAAAKWLARQEAIVTVTDQADAATLADSLPLLADAPIAALRLEGHREEDFRGADLVVVNPAVRPDSPWLAVARQSGARLCTEIELFMDACPARIIAVTGSNGKSTTAAMIASIFKAAGRRTFLGGNIGGSLLAQLPQMGRDDWVVLEISSFQLWHSQCIRHTPCADRTPHAPRAVTARGACLLQDAAHGVCRIHITVVTGCTPNHLDWHESFADYVAAKQRILAWQTPADAAVLNLLDPEVASWQHLICGRLIAVECIRHAPRAESAHGVCRIQSDSARGACGVQLDDLPPLPVPGRHNRINAACAAGAALAAGCDAETIRCGLTAFRGLPQRLEWFAVIEGRRFYNDSTATTPESTIAALESLEMPVWLLAGGKSKGADFGPLAGKIVRRTRGAAFFGAAAKELLARVADTAPGFDAVAVETMEQALQWCWPRSRPGDAIVLSPACASTDQFQNFRRRGEHFAELVGPLTGNQTVV
jgi:UDP-N-acetylmuramoylalanine--D-glutamate ligase